MNYKRIYDNIIDHRRLHSHSGYTEQHHIIPRSLGGSDDKDNLVGLSAKEHFICHLLLTKIYSKHSMEYYKVAFAFLMMLTKSKSQDRYITSRKYEELKRVRAEYLKTQTGDKNSQYGTLWICNKDENKNRKIKADEMIPEGWVVGRLIRTRPEKIRYCKFCSNVLTHKTKASFCNTDCKTQHRKVNIYTIEKTVLYGKDAEFLALYDTHHSINKSLKLMGYTGAGGYYKWAKQVLTDASIV